MRHWPKHSAKIAQEAGHSGQHPMTFALALIALGIVFGDIGTSPLYAFNEVFAHGMAPSRLHVLGAASLIFWGLMLPITVKYVGLALRINSDGEGGVFALYKIIKEIPNTKRGIAFIAGLLVFGAGLLYADGVITPAISVASAIEGLNTVHPIFQKLSEPITIVILTFLFAFQKKGTATIGKWFGWAMLVWFVSIGLLGVKQIMHQAVIWNALNPYYGASFLMHLSIMQRFIVLGYIMLAYTGGEALYADLGHVGAGAIRLCWLGLVYPCLILNYFGQGAYLLSGGHFDANRSIFYAIVPQSLTIPMVLLGAVATCIASQALITGAGSLTALAISLNLLPRIRIMHTNAEHKGQIYLPFLNGLLWLACIGIVLYFKTSGAMANAYGLAVAGVMLITSIALMVAAQAKLGWSPTKAMVIFGLFAIFDASMLVSNTLKFLEGGFVPVTIGVLLFLMMRTWMRGRRLIRKVETLVDTLTLEKYLALLNEKQSADYVHLYLISHEYSELSHRLPPSLNDNVLEPGYGGQTQSPSDVLFLSLKTEQDAPYVGEDRRFTASLITEQGFVPLTNINEATCDLPHHDRAVGTKKTNVYMVNVSYGHMESPDLVHELRILQGRLGIDAGPEHWGRFVDRLTLEPGPDLLPWQYAEIVLFSRMRRWTSPIYDYYKLSKLGTVHGVRLLRPIHRAEMSRHFKIDTK